MLEEERNSCGWAMDDNNSSNSMANDSLSMFQLTYPTIVTDQMKSMKHKTTKSSFGKVEDSDQSGRLCVYETNSGYSMPMTLVETISFDTSDFTDNFLTCPTCLSSFDEFRRLPRLLPCSHTICRECLETILNSNNGFNCCNSNSLLFTSSETCIKCPVCREAILMPRGGLDQLPPSYLINRLMDLVKSKKTRDYVPKCTIHPNENLLFCETCDCVFCSCCSDRHCVAGHQQSNGVDLEHVVVPFSVAIKRVSEIVNYKSNQCTKILDKAVIAIRQEMDKLSTTVQSANSNLEDAFQELYKCMEIRKKELCLSLDKLKEEKMQSLTEQLEIVQTERMKLEQTNFKLLRHPDIRKLTEQIQSLNSQVESGHLLAEPRENSFLKFECKSDFEMLSERIERFGKIKVSNTYPPLCTARVDGNVANVRCSVRVTAMDCNGNVQNVGGDPLTVVVTNPLNEVIKYSLDDSLTGSYNVSFLPAQPGRHLIDVRIFNRPIRGSPLTVDISEHNNPLWTINDSKYVRFPIDIMYIDNYQKLAVLDTGLKHIGLFLAESGEFLGFISSSYITETCTSFTTIDKNAICTLDWKSKRLILTKLNINNPSESVSNILDHNCRSFNEPILIEYTSADQKARRSNAFGCLLVLDSGLNQVVVLDIIKNSTYEALFRTAIQMPCGVRSMCMLDNRNLVYCCFDCSLRVCDMSLTGTHRKLDIKGNFTALTADLANRLLACKCEINQQPQCTIDIYQSVEQFNVLHKIDSYHDVLKRPYSICSDCEGHIVCADFGGMSLKKYRYF